MRQLTKILLALLLSTLVPYLVFLNGPAAWAGESAPLPASGTPVQAAAPSLPPPSFLLPGASRSEKEKADLTALQQSIRNCALLSASDVRLNCYDVVASHLPPLPSEYGGWVLGTEPDGTPNASLGSIDMATSEDKLTGSGASLFVKCAGKETEVYVAFGYYVATPSAVFSDVSIRYDDSENDNNIWRPSLKRTAVGLWTTKDAKAFLARLLETKKLAISVGLPDGRFATPTFDTSGAALALGPIQLICGPW